MMDDGAAVGAGPLERAMAPAAAGGQTAGAAHLQHPAAMTPDSSMRILYGCVAFATSLALAIFVAECCFQFVWYFG
jgi:hypothetical protein